MFWVCGFLLMSLLLPFQAAAAEVGSAVAAESSKSGVTMVAAGRFHSLALKEDGTVWAWGKDSLGNGTPYSSATPVQVKDLEEVVTVAAGGNHSLALKSDGTVWAWGQNEYGVLGEDPYKTSWRLTPVQVQGLSSVVAISANFSHNLALKSDGTVWAWGMNNAGQLGNGTTSDMYTSFYTPSQVQGLDSVIAVAAGPGTSLALKSDGTLWAWGGLVGDGTTESRSTPVQAQGLSSVVSFDAGDSRFVVKSDGTVWAWGWNGYGQLGDGTTTTRYTPVPLQELSSVAAFAADEWHSLALKSDGTVWEWGCNSKGEMCYESDIRTTPVQVQDLSSAVDIAAGFEHSLAVKSDGTVWAWGNNGYGQMGDAARTYHSTPIQVLGLGEPSPNTPEAPQWPAGNILSVTEATYNSVILNWVQAVDDTGIAGYRLYQDDLFLGNVTGTTYKVTGLKASTSYLFHLTAFDKSGNVSLPSPSLSVTTDTYTPQPEKAPLALNVKSGFYEVGSEVEVYVHAKDQQDLYAFLLKIGYDPAKLRLNQILLSKEFGVEGQSAVFSKNTSKAGLAGVSGSLLGSTTGRNGDVKSAVLKFTLLAKGSSEIVLNPGSSTADSKNQIRQLTEPVKLVILTSSIDFNGDGLVGLEDLVLISRKSGEVSGQTAGFDARYDINHDGVINVPDVQYVANKVASVAIVN
ncbi:hypothetical protein B2K_13375 [Paenibacillus mucilaginosus K02]|uniref:BNR repeat domain-containing protein n=2 Tax=Paenibacillus mucilaginosus TaxID=61624 RepID=I0BH50_9BACL|nr:hypothetical protein B2K_13375 [Paenibacillus mucilaginosus K02]AFK65447.1 BNR repeat domain-containing protein [Paenibacillus mucilaginosus K02]